MNGKLNKYSSRITQPPAQGASQAMLHATGLTRTDLDKAQVGISAVWFEGNHEDYEADRRRRLGDAAERPRRMRYNPLARG